MSTEGKNVCWFLTGDGWRESDDPVAIHDPETWPTGTVLAGLYIPEHGREAAAWSVHWRDRWVPAGEIDRLLQEYGVLPPVALAPAA